MGTVADTLAADEEGIIQRSLRQIFTTISTEFYYCVVNTRVSYIEIYNEECKDLLHPEIRSRVSVSISCTYRYLIQCIFTGYYYSW